MADRPKRRKHRDNPYTLSYLDEKNIYIISFKDGRGIIQKVEVSEEIGISQAQVSRLEKNALKSIKEFLS